MRIIKRLITFCTLILLAVTIGCGGSGGGDGGGSSTGTFSMSITDAKPMLPESPGKEIMNVFVTIDEVLVHKSGGGWVTLDLPDSPSPFEIDLLQFSDGFTTELVPPVALESGKYTQVRLSVTEARLRFADNSEIPLTIPSENLKTDKNFEFTVGGTAVDITIDFDLSKSLVLEGPAYKLKPVLHVVETAEAATIEGFITNSSFVENYVVIRVVDSTGQEYTKVQVDKDATAANGKTVYSIFWLVPNQAYTVEINYNPGLDDDPEIDGIQDNYDGSILVPPASDPNDVLQPGESYPLDFPFTT